MTSWLFSRQMRYVDSINQALHDILVGSAEAVLLGEDILSPYGGAFKATRSLSHRFPEQVVPTPISEAGIIGVAIGMAARGLRPIIEIMFGDFLSLGFDQILNHLAKMHGMYAGQVSTPVLIRTPMGGGRGYGPTHSQSIEKHFLGIPGLRIIYPSHFHSPGTLLMHAFDRREPTLFLEHKRLYPYELVQGSHDTFLHITPIGPTEHPIICLANHHSVPDVVLLTYGGTAIDIYGLLDRLFAEEINLTCFLHSRLDNLALDACLSAIAHAKAGVIIAEEGIARFNWGSEVCASLCERLSVVPRIRRLASRPCVVPAARHLEKRALLSADDIEQTVYELVELSMGNRK